MWKLSKSMCSIYTNGWKITLICLLLVVNFYIKSVKFGLGCGSFRLFTNRVTNPYSSTRHTATGSFTPFLHSILVIFVCNFHHLFSLFKTFGIHFLVDLDILCMISACRSSEFIIKARNKQ